MTGKEIRAKINKEYEDVAPAKLPSRVEPAICPLCEARLIYGKGKPVRLWEGEPKAYAEGWRCPKCRTNGYKITHRKSKSVVKFVTHIVDKLMLAKAKFAKSIAMLEVIMGHRVDINAINAVLRDKRSNPWGC